MESVIKIFNQLQSTTKKKEKEDIIQRNQDNKLFLDCLKFLLDSNVVTGISKKKIEKKVKPNTEINTSDFRILMNYLKVNNTGADIDVARVQHWINSQPKEHIEFYKQMVTKSLKLGCDYKTVNKALGYNLIDVWEVQLGSSQDKLQLKDNEWFSLSQKLNGNRCSFYHGKLISRQGKEFTGLQHIIDDINTCNLQDYFIDGELVGKNEAGLSDGENFRLSTGIINSDAESKEEIKFVIFDCFPAEEFVAKQSKEKYLSRYNRLMDIKQKIISLNLKNVEVVKVLYQGTDQSKVDEFLQYAVDNDWEGIMLNKNEKYVCKRTNNLIKIKRFYTLDLPIIDIVEGDGRLKGTLGALVVDFKGRQVNVGTGFDDATREKIWKNKDNYIGRICEVKYKEISKDKKTGLESLQFPVYVQIRELGKEVSYD